MLAQAIYDQLISNIETSHEHELDAEFCHKFIHIKYINM